MKHLNRSIIVLLAAILLVGCATKNDTHVITNQHNNLQLPFIRDGLVTRGQILCHLGPPVSTYENGRIITYWLMSNEEGSISLGDIDPSLNSNAYWNNRKSNTGVSYYNLILVFSEDDLLKKHNILYVR